MSGISFVKFLFEDEDFFVVEKPAKLAVHPSEMCRDRRTLLQLVRNKGGGDHVYPVHRLDKPVSGPVLFARSLESCKLLQQQFEKRTVEKSYIALLRGWLEGAGVVDHALKKPINGNLQECETCYTSLGKAELNEPCGKYDTVRYSLVDLKPITGRYHQLRRHCRDISHPILGDTTDGDSRQNQFFRKKFNLSRLMLHCYRLSFAHPITGKRIEVHLKPDREMCSVFEALKLDISSLMEGS